MITVNWLNDQLEQRYPKVSINGQYVFQYKDKYFRPDTFSDVVVIEYAHGHKQAVHNLYDDGDNFSVNANPYEVLALMCREIES